MKFRLFVAIALFCIPSLTTASFAADNSSWQGKTPGLSILSAEEAGYSLQLPAAWLVATQEIASQLASRATCPLMSEEANKAAVAKAQAGVFKPDKDSDAINLLIVLYYPLAELNMTNITALDLISDDSMKEALGESMIRPFFEQGFRTHGLILPDGVRVYTGIVQNDKKRTIVNEIRFSQKHIFYTSAIAEMQEYSPELCTVLDAIIDRLRISPALGLNN